MGVGQVFTMPPFFARNAIHPADIMPGAFAASLGGLDTLVFVGGIGENAAVVRARICDGLGFLGIALEEKRNGANEGVISAAASRVAVRVIRTDEEWMIASTVCRVLQLGAVKNSVLL